MNIKIVNVILICLCLFALLSCNQNHTKIVDKINELLNSNKTLEALTILDSVYNEEGWDFDSYCFKIEILLSINKIEYAKHILEFIQHNSYKFEDYNSTIYYYYQAMIFYKSVDYYNANKYWEFAMQNIEQTIKTNKVKLKDTIYYAISNLNSGLCNLNLMQYDKAIFLFDKAMKWYRQYNEKEGISKCFYHKAHCYDNMLNTDMAIKMLDSSIKYTPNFYDSYIQKGRILNQTGNYVDAINYYQKAMELDKENYLAYYDIGLIYKNMQDYSQALENLTKAYSLAPNKINILVEEAKIYKENNDNDDYINCMKKIIELNPNSEYVQNFINENKLQMIYQINKGFVYDFAGM